VRKFPGEAVGASYNENGRPSSGRSNGPGLPHVRTFYCTEYSCRKMPGVGVSPLPPPSLPPVLSCRRNKFIIQVYKRDLEQTGVLDSVLQARRQASILFFLNFFFAPRLEKTFLWLGYFAIFDSYIPSF